MQFVVVERDNDGSIFRQQLPQQTQPRPHHAEPFVVAFEVFLVHGVGGLFQPLLH